MKSESWRSKEIVSRYPYVDPDSSLIIVGLESSVRSLQSQLDASNRRAATTETILRTITQERDSAVSQLSVAYVTIKKLQAENEDLREENQVLRGPTQHLSEDLENASKTSRKANIPGNGSTKVPQVSNQNSPNRTTRFVKRSSGHVGTPPAATTRDLDMFDLTPEPQATINNSSKAVQQHDHPEIEQSERSVYEKPQTRGRHEIDTKPTLSRGGQVQNENSTRDLTYLSFLDSNEVAKLRRTLEQERVERKHRRTVWHEPSRGDPNNNEPNGVYDFTQKSEGPMPRKSSMKDLTSRSVNDNDEQAASANTKGVPEHYRRHSETSVLSTRSRRRRVDADKMTSAFIVPDITIRANAISGPGVPELSTQNKAVLEELAQHNSENCVVCKSNPNQDGPHNHTITIPKPIPISERMPTAGPYEEDPTVRPSQAPGLALATVIKGLEDEVAHLKIRLAKYQALFNGHDPALSKRKRKSVHEKIQSLLQTINVKSDQVYALYDVLEGQKQDGHEISEKEVEITLQSVGIQTAGLHLRGGGATDGTPERKTPPRRLWDLSSEDEDDDLPWEGIESTVETTRSGFVPASRRRSAAT